jgi:hypothetical protein
VLSRLRDALRGLRREGLPPGSATAYLFALACVGVAALAHLAFAWLGTDIAASILYNPAVFVAALVGGMRAGLVAVGFSILLLCAAFDAQVFAGRIATASQRLP